MTPEALKVGELARRTGLTVRTLHHYDEIGLVKPSQHTGAGYRLYTGPDIARLQQVVSLRQLGLSLEEVRNCLDRPGYSPLEVIDLHLARLKEQIESQRRLCERFDAIAVRLRSAGEVSADEFLKAIEETIMIETYFTTEQLERMRERRAEVGDDGLRARMGDWSELLRDVRAEMDRGTDPADPAVQALARRWENLAEFTNCGDPAMAAAVKRQWAPGNDAAAEPGSRPVWGYMESAVAAFKAKS